MAEELLECSESEIEEGLQEQDVVFAKRVIVHREGKEIPTKHVLSFQRRVPVYLKSWLHQLPCKSLHPASSNASILGIVHRPAGDIQHI